MLPVNAHRLNDYARYYTGEIVQGRKLVRGYYLLPPYGEEPGVYLRESNDLVADGGCSVVTVYYDPATHSFADIRCNGYA